MNRFVIASALVCASSISWAQEQGPLKWNGSLANLQSSDGVIISRIAMHKGDILTIVVNEQSTGSTNQSTNSSKKDATTVNASTIPAISSITGLLGGSLGNILNSPLKGGSTGVTSATAGAGSTSTATSVTNTVSVIVKEVLPNGNLIIEGKRTIGMNKQTVTFTLEGTVRRDDIAINNTIQSNQIADLRLVQDGKGLIADRHREGFLTKILSWVF